MSECSICGEIYCSRECLRSSWKSGHRKICEAIYDQNEVQVWMNHLEGVEKYNQKKLNLAYGFDKDAKPNSFLSSSRASLEQMGALKFVTDNTPDTKLKADAPTKKVQNVRAIRCFNTDCLKTSENLEKMFEML